MVWYWKVNSKSPGSSIVTAFLYSWLTIRRRIFCLDLIIVLVVIYGVENISGILGKRLACI